MYVHYGEETNIGDPRSYKHYWTNSWNAGNLVLTTGLKT